MTTFIHEDLEFEAAGLDPSVIETFNSKIQGNLVLPGDPDYDETRKLWNGMFDKKPAMIARCRSTADVAIAVEFAGKHHLLLAVKGGGHNSAGTGSCDGGLMIDLSGMNKVEINQQNQTVKVQGGCLLSELDKATQKFGWAVPSGIVSHTGVGGLTLGGGFGWISRTHGLAIDNLLSAEMVTADGTTIMVSENENAELFWAIRGGGGNFGVVTEFEFKCANTGTEIYSGVIAKKFDDLPQFMRFYRDYAGKMPDEMTLWLVIRHAPPVPFIPEAMHGKMVGLLAFAWLGDQEKGETLTQPLRDAGETIGDGSAMHPYVAWQSAFDGLYTHGARNYWKSHHFKNLSDECIDVIMEYASKLPSKETEIFLPHMEGAPARVPANATAFSYRKEPFLVNLHTRWQNTQDDEKCKQWTSEFHKATQPFSEGVYVNFLGDEGQSRVKDAYLPEVWEKLVRIKRQWDPDNLFRVNQNIQP